MYSPATFEMAFQMMIASTICWGSWANTYKATTGYRFELFYWDYAVGNIVIALIAAFTLGSSAHGPASFLNNIHAATTTIFFL